MVVVNPYYSYSAQLGYLFQKVVTSSRSRQDGDSQTRQSPIGRSSGHQETYRADMQVKFKKVVISFLRQDYYLLLRDNWRHVMG